MQVDLEASGSKYKLACALCTGNLVLLFFAAILHHPYQATAKTVPGGVGQAVCYNPHRTGAAY
jgi:hypothetical protein